jgi:hypothetical protein
MPIATWKNPHRQPKTAHQSRPKLVRSRAGQWCRGVILAAEHPRVSSRGRQLKPKRLREGASLEELSSIDRDLTAAAAAGSRRKAAAAQLEGHVSRVQKVELIDGVAWLTLKWKGKDPSTGKPWPNTNERLPDMWAQGLEATNELITAAVAAYNLGVPTQDRIVAKHYTKR